MLVSSFYDFFMFDKNCVSVNHFNLPSDLNDREGMQAVMSHNCFPFMPHFSMLSSGRHEP